MQDPRYAPPTADELLTQTPLARQAVRPLAVWLLLLLLVIVGLGWLGISLDAGRGLPIGGAALLVSVLLAPVEGGLAFFAFSLWRGWRWSRWGGVVVIFGLGLAQAAFSNANRFYAQGGGVVFIAYVLLPLLCLWWACALTLSVKARRYFGLLQK